MTSEELKLYAEELEGMDADELAAALYHLSSGNADGVVAAFNSARFGPDVRDDITMMVMLMRAYWAQIGVEAEDALTNAYRWRGILPTSVTSMTTVTDYGWYGINSANYAVLQDMPTDFGSSTSASILRVESVSGTTKLQRLTHSSSSRTWERRVNSSTGNASDWELVIDIATEYKFRGMLAIPSETTSLADVAIKLGFYGLPEGIYAKLNDLPRDFPRSKTATLQVEALSGSSKIQRLTHVRTGRQWARTIIGGNTTTVGEWRLYNEGRKKITIKNAGNNGDAVERILIYIPDDTGYMIYQLYHYENASINCNDWHINYILHRDHSFSNESEIQLTNAGEWECAIKLVGRDDFSGGHTHGDEVKTSAVLYLDGVPTATSDLPESADEIYVDEVRFIENSYLYDPNDSTTPIAEHGKEYIFTLNGMRINQSLEWLGEYDLSYCYMAMALPRKHTTPAAPETPEVVTNRAYADFGMSVVALDEQPGYETTDGYSVTFPNAKRVVIYNEQGFTIETNLIEYPTGLPGGDKAIVKDNSSVAEGVKNYNKLYFVVCNSGTSTQGEKWRSQAEYKMRMTYITPTEE